MKFHRNRQRMGLLPSMLLTVATCLTGCGESELPTAQLVPATGTVKINGEPAANVMVQYLPEATSDRVAFPSSTGVTDEDGSFELKTTDGKPGAIMGRGKVLLTDLTEERVPQGQTAKPPRFSSKYAVLGPQSIEVEVAPNKGPIVIDIPK